MSGNDEEQNIINGKAPKESYYKHKKKGTNYSKRVQKELNNTELKLNLNTLALELGKQKAINKPLQNKIAKLVLGRPRKETLQEAYNNLQQIEYNFKNDKLSDKERPFKNKNFTIKELKKIDEEAKKSYNVYRKFILIVENSEKDKTRLAYNEEMQILSRQLADGFIDEDEYMKFGNKIKYEYEYRNVTTPVKGLYNIKNEIKDDLDYFMTMPYVLKVDVVKVVINKIDGLKSDNVELNDKTYRYRGAIDKKEIVYDKAWNANKNLFQYKAYNMDPNNETPLECVPNALFKMYGDKSKGKTYYNGKIANGGMEYIKKMLDIGGESAYLDCIDDNEPQLIEGKKGYSPMDILNFCNDHKIRCFGYDWMMNQFITNKDLNIDFHHHLPAFVFYFNDHHIYLINDKDVRHALLNCNKTVDVTALAKEKKQKQFTKDLLIDIPKEEWTNHAKTNIYITDNRLVHNTFYKLACAGDVYNVGIKMSEKEGITRFKYENGNMIIFNPDIIQSLKQSKF